MQSRRFISTFMVLMLLIGCRAAPTVSSTTRRSDALLAPAKPMLRTELIFGLSRQGGVEIGDAEWQAFVNDTITPRFPDGFTVMDGYGQWKGSDGKIEHERSKIVLILHGCDDGSVLKLDQIRDIYKQRFAQESVIRETAKVWVAF